MAELKQQRDLLRQQVNQKRQVSEKNKLKKEIAELQSQLSGLEMIESPMHHPSVPSNVHFSVPHTASPDVPFTGPSVEPSAVLSGVPQRPLLSAETVNIQDLRKMETLNRKVENRMPTGLQELQNTNITGNPRLKSGKSTKSSEISVKNPQYWPHSFVPSQICHQGAIEFSELSLQQFVAGYCSILMHIMANGRSATNIDQVNYRLSHLK